MRFTDPLFDSQHLVLNFTVVLHEHLLRADSGPWSLHASSASPYELFISYALSQQRAAVVSPFPLAI